MKFKPVKFKVYWSTAADGWRWIEGYAVETMDCPVRFAVADIDAWGFAGKWCATHWDTGCALGVGAKTRSECAHKAIAILNKNIANGKYALAMWCIEKDRVIHAPEE